MSLLENIRHLAFIFFIAVLSMLPFSHEVYASDHQPQSVRILIFVSSSMPETSFVQWMQEARALKPPAALIMRGFVHDSLPETRDFVERIVKASHGTGGVSVDPVLFEKYDIKTVPAVVVETVDSDNANNSKFDVIYGNTSLTEALRVISEKGDTADNVKKLFITHTNGGAND